MCEVMHNGEPHAKSAAVVPRSISQACAYFVQQFILHLNDPMKTFRIGLSG